MAADRVWWNLHKRCWSTAAGSTRVRHATALRLVGAVFVVSEAGRQRVLSTRCRSVHAHAKGVLADVAEVPAGAVWVSYNPYRGGSFYRKDTGADVTGARELHFLPDGRVLAIGPYQGRGGP
jgi:hypothetical protein